MHLPRSRTALRLAACLALALVLLAACGGDGDRSVVGVIIDVEAGSPTDVESFTVRDADGQQLLFHVAPEAAPDPREGFTPTHLRSHSALAEPVKVVYRKDGDTLLALRLEDQ